MVGQQVRPTLSQYQRAYAYAGAIRNPHKRSYAHAIIDAWRTETGVDSVSEDAYATDLGYMARQAVRQQVSAILAF